MTSFKDPNTRRELIMKHYSLPMNKTKIEKADVDLYSNHCVDEIHINLILNGDVIEDAKFDGEGCAVFIASSDIMLNKIKGKSKAEAKQLVLDYQQMITDGKTDKEELLEELLIFENVSSHLNRLHCAEMVSNALMKVL